MLWEKRCCLGWDPDSALCATTAVTVEDAALPFNKRRFGHVAAAGGMGLVLKTELSMVKDYCRIRPSAINKGDNESKAGVDTKGLEMANTLGLQVHLSDFALEGLRTLV
jgi:hypothetical protein